MNRTRSALFCTGLVTLLGQVVLLREQLVASFGVELAAVMALGTLLLGGASGALCGRWMGEDAPEKTSALFLAFAAIIPSAILFLRAQPALFAATPGAYLPLPQQLLGTLAAFAPAGFLGGALFQRLAVSACGAGRSLAWAYAVESAGGVAGGLLATLALEAGISNLQTGFAVGLLAALASIRVAPRGRRSVAWKIPAFLLCAALLVALPMSGSIDLATARWTQSDLVEVADTPYARLSLSRREGQVAVFQDRALLFESEGTSAEEFVHPAALQVPKIRSVLLLGGGAEGTLAEVLKHEPEKVVLVEMDRAFHRSVVRNLGPVARAAFSDPRVRTVFSDPRGYLRGSGSWDLILVGVSEPSNGQSNRFFTREFFDLCSLHLAPEGVLALRLRSAENLWTPLMAKRNASVVGALRGAFPETLVLPGTSDLLLASRGRLTGDPEVLGRRWRSRRISARLVCEPYLSYLFENGRVGAVAATLKTVRAAPNRDSKPICHLATAGLWLSRFFPQVARWEWGGGAGAGPVVAGAWAAGLLLAVLLAWATAGRDMMRRVSLAAAAGFSGMVLETALLLAYQSWMGALYRDIGLLMTLFMGGLALGAAGAARLGAASGPASAGFGVLLCLATAAVLRSGPHGAWTLAALLLGAGATTGGLFAGASEGSAGPVSPGKLYGADLAGAAAGAVFGGMLILPLLGMAATSLALAGGMVLAAGLSRARTGASSHWPRAR